VLHVHSLLLLVISSALKTLPTGPPLDPGQDTSNNHMIHCLLWDLTPQCNSQLCRNSRAHVELHARHRNAAKPTAMLPIIWTNSINFLNTFQQIHPSTDGLLPTDTERFHSCQLMNLYVTHIYIMFLNESLNHVQEPWCSSHFMLHQR